MQLMSRITAYQVCDRDIRTSGNDSEFVAFRALLASTAPTRTIDAAQLHVHVASAAAIGRELVSRRNNRAL